MRVESACNAVRGGYIKPVAERYFINFHLGIARGSFTAEAQRTLRMRRGLRVETLSFGFQI